MRAWFTTHKLIMAAALYSCCRAACQDRIAQRLESLGLIAHGEEDWAYVTDSGWQYLVEGSEDGQSRAQPQ